MVNSNNTLSRKIAVVTLFLAVAGCSLLIYSMPLKDVLNQSHQIKSWLAETGYAAPAVFTLATALLTAIGMPRLLLCSLAGMVFGFNWGFVCSHLGTVLGAYLPFIFARWSGREFVQQKFPKIIALSASTQARGWRYVLFMRQLPISGLYNDILLGLSTVSHCDFWIGTALGFLPLGVTATLIGAGAIHADITHLAQYLGIAACAFFFLTLSLKWILAQMQRKNASIG
ncbi:MAG: VTT domain-containing protein [Methylococcales bacterium]|nr:VTT domain-containing protein [Methylococcales bacterium]